MLQLNEELQRAGVTAAQQETASKQLLQVLIDRQLLQEAAAKENLDRDPKVMQAIDRAKSLIIAQAYLQKRVGSVAKPTAPLRASRRVNDVSDTGSTTGGSMAPQVYQTPVTREQAMNRDPRATHESAPIAC